MSSIFYFISAVLMVLGILFVAGFGFFFGSSSTFFIGALGMFATGAVLRKLEQIAELLGGKQKPAKNNIADKNPIDDIPEQFRT